MKKLLLLLAGLAAVGLVAFMVLSNKTKGPLPEHGPPAGPKATVEIRANGFIPASLIVKKGTTVIWTNQDTEEHWVASDPHPAHTGLPGLNSNRGLKSGESYAYTFTTTGTFGYHDNLHPTLAGSIQVSE